MATSTRAERVRRVRASIFNLPNQLTSLRLLLAMVLFGFIACEYFLVGFVLFVIAASTDWLDGYYARKYGQVTTLGRILDPFADKVIICGAFVFLLVSPEMLKMPWYGLRAWMVVVIVGRELLVTALRSFMEERGSDFSAKMSGKVKMLLQCIAAGACILYLASRSYGDTVPAWVPVWLEWTTIGLVWTAVLSTVYSGVVYVLAAVELLRDK